MRRLALLLAAALLLTCACAKSQARVRLVFFAAGKADAILIKTADSAVLVDAGLDADGGALAEKLRGEGVEALDLMIVTHFDKDHVGGADAVLSGIPVARVCQPAYEKDSKQYRQYLLALEKAGLEPETLAENIAFSLDGVDYEIDVANQSDYGEDEENDFSLVVRLKCGEARALLAGDAEETRLEELIGEGDLASGLLKVPHHGRFNGCSRAFFAAVSPRLAVITSSDDQREDGQTVRALREAGARVLLTREGDAICESDGREWLVR